MVQAVDDNSIVIIDNGSGMMKAGVAGMEAPSVEFPTIVGRPKKNEYIGDDAQQDVLDFKYPIINGIVSDWEDMEKIWHHTFYNQLRVDPREVQGVVVTDQPKNPKKNRECMLTSMFETFEVQNMYVALQSVMPLYANGRSTGLVIESGYGATQSVPVLEGNSIPHAVMNANEISGSEITKYVQKLL